VASDSNAATVEAPVAEHPSGSQLTQPELARAFADVKKFELTTVQLEAKAKAPAEAGPQQSVGADQPSRIAIVTTDPVKNVMQQQLPPRIVPLLKVIAEAKPADRSKLLRTGNDWTASMTETHFTDLVRPIERVDQTPAAHPIEIPNIPHLPVMRIVAMQVGEPDSEVTVRIQQRDGSLTLQMNADSEQLHQNLQSSVGALSQALKLEQVPVSRIEVSRKSLTDRVRRTKETQ